MYFTTYQWARKQFASYLLSVGYKNDILQNLLASVTAGAVSNVVIAPMWTIRTRMMTQTNHQDYRNSFHAIKKIYQTEGLYALYRGLVPSMLGLVCRKIFMFIHHRSFVRFMWVFNFHCMNI